MLIELLFLLVGIALLVKGADLFVDHATSLGKSLRLPQVLIGILVVAVGTSLPELAVSVIASMHGHPEIAAGNIIGSNIANIGLVIGISALFGAVTLSKRAVDFDIPISILPLGVLVFGYILNITLAFYVGCILLFSYVCYLAFSTREYRAQMEDKSIPEHISGKNLVWLLIGLVLLIVGADVTVRNAESLAAFWGLKDTFVGSILLALGTSLPELVTTIIAVLKKEGDLAIGNVLGSSVFNMLAVLGVSSMIHAIQIDKLVMEVVFLGVMSFVFLVVAKTGKKYAISKPEGGLLIVVYFVYIIAAIGAR